ncbi:hypothetical protein ONZ45_g7622 [Pleurotus djamor]|nr:hypothetical protein ONZ45_g7622 [Pleurotus djamor]
MPAGMQMLPNGQMTDPHSYQFQMTQALSQGTGANIQHRPPQQMQGMRMNPSLQNAGAVGVAMNPHIPPFVNQPPHPQQQQQQMRRVAPNQPGPPFNQQMVMGMSPGNPSAANMGIRPHTGPPMGPQVPRNVNSMSGLPPDLLNMRSQGLVAPNQGGGMVGTPNNMPGMPNNRPPQPMGALNQPPIGGHFPNNVNTNFNPQQPPQMTSSPRPGSSHMSMPVQSQTPISRARMTPDHQQQQQQGMFQNGPSFQGGTPRMGPSNQFPFVAAAGSPNSIGNVGDALGPAFNQPGGPMTPGAPGSRLPVRAGSSTGFHVTPAQQFEHMSGSYDQFPRPPSQMHTPQHSSTPQMNHASPINHSSPSQQNISQQQLTPSNPQIHPPRPQSQPQGPSVRPPSQAGPSHTPNPHPSATMMNQQGNMPNASPMVPSGGRISRQQSHPSLSTQISPINNAMPPQMANQVAGASQNPSIPGARPPNAQPNGIPGPSNGEGTAMMSRAPTVIQPPVGSGQGLVKLLQFSGVLAQLDNLDKKMRLDWWQDLIKEYFSPKAIMKFTLWKDSQRQEAKPFAQSGVQSMTLSLDGARERLYSTGHSVVECVNSVWTYKYANGYTVTLRGPLTVHVVVSDSHPPGSLAGVNAGPLSTGAPAGTPTFAAPGAGGNQAPQLHLKFEDFQFDAFSHDKYISIDQIHGLRRDMGQTDGAPMPNGQYYGQNGQGADRSDEQRWVVDRGGSIPAEPVNAFGIPQATMRCLELAESVGQMSDLIAYTRETKLGPIDALKRFAATLREKGAVPPQPAPTFPPFPGNPPASQAPYLLYSQNPNAGPTPYPPPNHLTNPQAATSPQASTSAGNSPQKQHKTIPQQPGQGVSPANAAAPAPATSTAATAGGSTPSLANAGVKRKQGSETASPTTSNADQPPAKRQVRKRKSTQS